MSNPTVSFRISDYHLARGLRAVRLLEANWKLTTPADLIRTIFQDYIAKSETLHNSPLDVTPALLQEIALSRANLGKPDKQPDIMPQLGMIKQPGHKTAQQIQRDIDDEKLFNDLRQESAEKLARQKAAQAQQSPQDKDLEEQIKLATQSAKRLCKPSEFKDPNITDSIITTVTDFSPPKEWIDSEE